MALRNIYSAFGFHMQDANNPNQLKEGAQAADRDDDHRRSAISERHFYDNDRGYYTRQADNWREERREAFEYRYRDYDHRRDYRNTWDRDRGYNREYNRDHRDRDRD